MQDPTPAMEKVRRVEHCPGNRTRYDCIVADMGDEGFLFTWLKQGNGGSSMLVTPGSMVAAGYFSEKMNLSNVADVAPLLVLLHQETGNPVMLPSGFNSRGLWDGTSNITLGIEE